MRVPRDPEELFGDLARKRDAIGALWSHQADQLRTYYNEHTESPDVALELPTGSGKTMVGLLVGEWRRRAKRERVVYACPTKQLAEQVVSVAKQQGIPAALLVGKSADWDQRQMSDYTRAGLIAVTTYSAVFNVNSRFAEAQTILFDDAHAAENYVAGAWSVEIPRSAEAYKNLLDAFGDGADAALVERMTASSADSISRQEVRLMALSAVSERLGEIRAVLSSGLDKDNSFRYSMIRESLEGCLFYVGREGWLIRPFIPPTFQHAPFTAANQRVYLSATLGEAGELERAFGRREIARVPVPPVWERSGAGRRFIVFPQLATGSDGDESILKRIAALTPKSLILTPDYGTAEQIAEHLEIDENDQFRADTKDGLKDFVAAAEGTLLAANRYDGMDLAGDQCRLEILAKAPELSHLQDRFIGGKLGAQIALRERVRTRITQGLGRTTRGTRDWSVVVVWGEDLLRYFSNTNNTSGMPVELQAEIEFGFEASRSASDNVIALCQSALAQDDFWVQGAEPRIADNKSFVAKVTSPMAVQLASVASVEVRAWEAAWRRDWATAADLGSRVLDGLTLPAARPYRALWAYLTSAWFRRSATTGDLAAAERARQVLEVAHTAAGPNTWLRDVEPLIIDQIPLSEADEFAIESIVERVNAGWRSASRFSAMAQDMVAGLTQFEASPYEQALVSLGSLLGAKSWKPSGKGRCDAAWVWPNLWIAVEAKSEQTADMLSMDYVRKTNTQLDSLAADEESPVPEDSISVIVGTTELVDPEAVKIAVPNLYLAMHSDVLDLGHSAQRVSAQIRASVSGMTLEHSHDTVARLLRSADLLPSQLRERLSRSAIRDSE